MAFSWYLLASLLCFGPLVAVNKPLEQFGKTKTVYDFQVVDIQGNPVKLSKYKGKVLLIVNVASKCGLTGQYEDLQKLYETYEERGLVVLGFPANNFMGQEPGTNNEINSFCTQKYGVTFPMFGKISVKGRDMAPLYQYLTQKKENGRLEAEVSWNFQKFLVGRDGLVLESFAPRTKVKEKEFLKALEAALGAKG